MKKNFKPSLERVLVHEGGYVNDPDDPGGPTNRGVTQSTYNGFRRRKGLAPRSVRLITVDEIGEIYKSQYWDAIRGDELPDGLDYAVFDFAVNSGVMRASKYLQMTLGVGVDGVIGEKTLASANEKDIITVLEDYIARRMQFLRQIRKGGGWKKFGKGWTRRVVGEQDGYQEGDTGVIDIAILMIHSKEIPLPTAPVAGKAIVPDREGVGSSKIAQSALLDIAAKAGVGITVIPQLDTNLQLMIGAAVLLMTILSFIIFRERLKAWADGWR